MKTIFAIDETGSFNVFGNDRSFVCGAVIRDETLENHFQATYAEMHQTKPPLGTELLKQERFHFCKLDNGMREICRRKLLPLVSKVYCSSGKPALFANNQDWWLVALTVVVTEFLREERFERGSRVEIRIDGRAPVVWGIGDAVPTWGKYHGELKQQLEKYFESEIALLKKNNSVEVRFDFTNDSEDFFVALADIACGCVRSNMMEKSKIVRCDCIRYQSRIDPARVFNSNPALALDLAFQEVGSGNWKHCELIEQILCKMSSDEELNEAFERFYDLIKGIIGRRFECSQLSDFLPIVQAFENRLKTAKIGSSAKIKIMRLIMEFYSHIGSTELAFSEAEFFDAMDESRAGSETRLLRKWEDYVAYHLRAAQIAFNAYRFENVEEKFEKLYDQYSRILGLIPEGLFERKEKKRKDEHLTAILGTLAQSYAYAGKFDESKQYFDLSMDSAIRSSSRTASYLFSVAFLEKDFINAEKYFRLQTGFLPQEYFSKKDFSDGWMLLSYCKLRALDLHLNGESGLGNVDIEGLKGYGSDYPFPLIQKWAGIAMQIEDPDRFRIKIEKYYVDAVRNLQKNKKSFVYRTLALPVIQCLALLNPQNEFQSQYNTRILSDLKAENSAFTMYIDEKKPFLNKIKNDADLWNRAASLPFIYS